MSGSISTTSLRNVVVRELTTLAEQVKAYPSDEALWQTVPGISNSGGNLALHLAGNLRHFIGATLGGTGYVRDRDGEFSARGLTRSAVVAEIEAARAAVAATFEQLRPEQVTARFPLDKRGIELATEQFLLHLYGHLAYHLGQIDYHRRITTGTAGEVSGWSIDDLVRPTADK